MAGKSILDPKYDLVYRDIFKREDILISFLNAILIDFDITKVKIIDTDNTDFSVYDRADLIPAVATTFKNEMLNIELYKLDKYDVYEREISFISEYDFEDFQTSNTLHTKLQTTTIVIVIADCELEFIKNEEYHNIYSFKNKELHYLELPKVKFNDDNDILQFFLQFFKDKLEVLSNKKSYEIKGLFEAIVLLFELSNKSNSSEIESHCFKSSLDRVSYFESAIARAERNRKLEIARNFLDIADDKTIAKKTGLDISDVRQLRVAQLEAIIQDDLNEKVKEIKVKGLIRAEKDGLNGEMAQAFARNFVKGYYGNEIKFLMRVLHESEELDNEKKEKVILAIGVADTVVEALRRNPSYVIDMDNFDIK